MLLKVTKFEKLGTCDEWLVDLIVLLEREQQKRREEKTPSVPRRVTTDTATV